ncbi:MAG: sulfite exporter TauE/SafE family protein [Pseudaminobacter sp.]
MPEIPLSEILTLVAALLAAGAVTGLFAGLFGVGGGAIAVPAFYELFRLIGIPDEVRMPLCVGTSLAIIIPTSIRSFNAHRARGAVDMDILRQWAVPVVAGVAIGSIIARHASPDLFKIVFIIVAGFSGTRLLFGRSTWHIADRLPPRPVVALAGGVIGLASALMGVGGGVMSNLFMTFYNRPIHQAVATSSGVGVLISIPGTIGYVYAGWPQAAQFPQIAALQPPLALGFVSLLGFILFIPMSTFMAPLGARLAHGLSPRHLKIAFGLFLVSVCLRFALSLL